MEEGICYSYYHFNRKLHFQRVVCLSRPTHVPTRGRVVVPLLTVNITITTLSVICIDYDLVSVNKYL